MSLTQSSLIKDIETILIKKKRLAISTGLVMRFTARALPGKVVLTSLVNLSLILGLCTLVKKMVPTTVPALGSARRW